MTVGDRHIIPVVAIEVIEGGKALWVHDANGGTPLRIQCTGQVVLDLACSALVAHGDINVIGDIKLCIPNRTEGCDDVEGVGVGASPTSRDVRR